MMMQKKLIYMLLGGFLALALTFGAFATFAQTDDDTDGAATTPGFGRSGGRGVMSGMADVNKDGELLAEALGITVAELQAAQEAARAVAIAQAVTDGLLTQEQADELLSGSMGRHRGLPGGRFNNGHTFLAEALGITTEELEAAQAEAFTARLALLVEAGDITQEQADQMQAYKNVQGYVDYDALNDSVRSYFEAAITQALADGVITRAQADEMLNNLTNMNMRGFGGPGFGGRGRGHHGGHGAGGFAPMPQTPADTTIESSGA
ncbi:MAG: hypothetical protein IAE79_16820 [Anaerolinea sp.]|nr:hypothetical protein [Anaerolinea sp.]